MIPLFLKEVLDRVKGKHDPKGTEKPWGREVVWADVEHKYTGKFLCIKEGHRLSLQYHQAKHETMMVIAGKMRLVYRDQILTLSPGDTVEIPPHVQHRPMAVDGDVVILEISTWDNGDVVRLDDDYGR